MRRPLEPPQYTSIAFTAHLMAEGILASIGTVGDALDNALAESAIGLYKAELINRRGRWRALAHVETATAGYLHWFNTQRIHGAIGDKLLFRIICLAIVQVRRAVRVLS